MERTIDLQHVVYEFCREDGPYNRFSFEEIINCNQSISYGNEEIDLKSSFTNSYQKFQKDFKDILRIFGVEFLMEDLKVDSQYMFDMEGCQFLIELVKRYRTRQVWIKGIKKLNTYTEGKNDFLKLYKESKYPDEVCKELCFAVEGLIRLYDSVETVDKSKKEELKHTIWISTQYQTICWQNEMKRMIQDVPELLQAEFEHSVSGILLEDYMKWLKKLKEVMYQYLQDECVNWNLTLQRREAEYERMLQESDEEVSDLIEEMTTNVQVELAKRGKVSNNKQVQRTRSSLEAELWREEMERVSHEKPEIARKLFSRFQPDEL